jgi:integrase
MKSTFSILFYLRTNRVSKEGKSSIMVRITVDGSMVQVNSKLEVTPDLWNSKAGSVIGKTIEAKEINVRMNSIRVALTNIYHCLSDRETVVTAEMIRNMYLGVNPKTENLLDLFHSFIKEAEESVGIKITKATLYKYKRAGKYIGEFIKYKYNLSDIPLKQLTLDFIKKYEDFLRVKKAYSANSAAKLIQITKKVVFIAKDSGWIVADPFANYTYNREKVDRGYLTKEELERIINKKFSIERLDMVRDIFVFSCYTGLAFIDVLNLTYDDIQTSFDGKMWIMKKRQKTNTSSNIPLLDIPLEILKKYEDRERLNNKVLPVMSNQKTNSYLKEIADLCEIPKYLTFHLARHTFATTVTLSNGVPIETVSKMLGHTSIQTTQIYARIINEKVSQDMEALANKLKQHRN